MIVRRFLLWCRTANAADRAAGVHALGQAYIYSNMSVEERREAETAMLAILDDPSLMVRKSLARAIAPEHAPRSVVLGLVADQPEIANLMLAASPSLSDDDLVDAVATAGPQGQLAVASRREVSFAVTAALVEVGDAAAVAVILRNPGADVGLQTMERAVERFGSSPDVRDALLRRDDLPAALRQQIAVEIAEALRIWAGSAGLVATDRAARIARESTDRVAVALATESHRAPLMADELEDLVQRLRQMGRLTPGLILRSLVTGETALAEAALANLSGIPLPRTAGIIHDRRGFGMPALCRKAGVPEMLIPAFAAAVEALREIGQPASESQRATTFRRIIERVLIACESSDASQNASLMALLRRYEAEAARAEAQAQAEALADHAALSALLEIDPELLVLVEPETAANDQISLVEGARVA